MDKLNFILKPKVPPIALQKLLNGGGRMQLTSWQFASPQGTLYQSSLFSGKWVEVPVVWKLTDTTRAMLCDNLVVYLILLKFWLPFQNLNYRTSRITWFSIQWAVRNSPGNALNTGLSSKHEKFGANWGPTERSRLFDFLIYLIFQNGHCNNVSRTPMNFWWGWDRLHWTTLDPSLAWTVHIYTSDTNIS